MFYNNRACIIGGDESSTNACYIIEDDQRNYGYTPISAFKNFPPSVQMLDTLRGQMLVYKNNIYVFQASGCILYKFDNNKWDIETCIPDTSFYEGTAVVYNNKIHLMGGGSSDRGRNKHYVWDGESWDILPVLPVQIQRDFAVVYNNEIHLFSDNGHYVWSGSAWSASTSLPYDAYNGSAVVYNNEIHLFVNSRYHYAWRNNRWVELTVLPVSSQYLSSCLYNNCIYIREGGKFYIWDGSTYTTEQIALNEYTETFGSIISYDDSIYIYSYGQYYNGNFLKYTLNKGLMVVGSYLPYYLYNGSAVVYNSEIHILGGQNNTTKHYKWDGTSWVPVSTLPYDFYDGSAVAYNNEIHIFGSNITSHQTKHYRWNGSNWASVSTLPYNFVSDSAVVCNNEIRVLGYCNNYYRFNGSTWTLIKSFGGNKITNSSAIYHDGSVYVIGTYSGSASIYKISDENLGITSIAHVGKDSFRGSISLYDGCLHAFISNDHLCYDLITGVSNNDTNVPYVMPCHSAVVLEDGIHILGGGNKNSGYALPTARIRHNVYNNHSIVLNDMMVNTYITL